MKALPFKIPKPHNDALIYQEDHEIVFYDKFHLHEEIQLSFIAKGTGTLVVGDSVSDYKEGDILVIGSNVPHVFKSDKNEGEKSLMLTLFFTKDAFGPSFFELEELHRLLPFFKRAEHGFKVLSHKVQLSNYFRALQSQSKFERLISLLHIIQITSRSKYLTLSSYKHARQYTATEGKRMSAIMEYTMNNYQQTIYLDDVAKVAAMTKNALCKYFKKRTNKTYIQFLNELRLEHAVKLLGTSNDASIAEIAEASGFKNISNFNRQFKHYKGVQPSTFKMSLMSQKM